MDGKVYEVIKKKTGVRSQKLAKSKSKPKSQPVPAKRKFGTARGTIILKPGWDDPITEEELSKFLRD